MNIIARIYDYNRQAIRIWLSHDVRSMSPQRVWQGAKTILRGLCISGSVQRRSKHSQRLKAAGKMYEHLPKAWWEFWWTEEPDPPSVWLTLSPQAQQAEREECERFRRAYSLANH